MLKVYAEFEIDEQTGEALTIHNRIDLHYNRVLALQVGETSQIDRWIQSLMLCLIQGLHI